MCAFLFISFLFISSFSNLELKYQCNSLVSPFPNFQHSFLLRFIDIQVWQVFKHCIIMYIYREREGERELKP